MKMLEQGCKNVKIISKTNKNYEHIGLNKHNGKLFSNIL